MTRRKTTTGRSSTGTPARQRIVFGARRHFFAHGFRGVTVDDLADELGMSKKTLYAHFHSKPAIVEAAILDKFHDLETDLKRVTIGHSHDFLGALRQLLTCTLRHAEEIQPPFLRDIRRDSPDLFKLIDSRRTVLIQKYFGRLFTAGRRSGMIRRDISTALLVEILLAAIQGVMNPRKFADLSITPKTVLSAILSVILEGILTRIGRTRR